MQETNRQRRIIEITNELDGMDVGVGGSHRDEIYRELVEERAELMRQERDEPIASRRAPIGPELARQIHRAGGELAGRSEDFALAVEEAWTELTKGELFLTGDGVEADGEAMLDRDLRAIVDRLSLYARETIEQTGRAMQFDARGMELDPDEPVSDAELARRIARALELVLYGGS